MKKLLIALLMAGVLGGAVYAAAASLTVNAGALQTGTDSTLQCDPDGVILVWNDTAPGDGDIETVNVNGINANCVGAALTLTTNGAETCGTVLVLLDTPNYVCDVSPDAPISSTTSVTVSLIGGGSTP